MQKAPSVQFRFLFTKKHLRDLYKTNIKYRPAVGTDGLSIENFEKRLNLEINIIHRKINIGIYSITKYRGQLISRGHSKPPRVVSIPTIRDKLVLRCLTDLLSSVFHIHGGSNSLHALIASIRNIISSEKFDSFIRLDIKNYYPSIPHDRLGLILYQKIRKAEIYNIIMKAIKTPTRCGTELISAHQGVPQGLPISNVLSDIYIKDVDALYLSRSDLAYYRYVDDILIICKSIMLPSIRSEIISILKKKGLSTHPKIDEHSKTQDGLVDKGFSYLGYVFMPETTTVRKQSQLRLHESIIAKLTVYKHSKKKNLKHLEWSLNLQITGCIYNEKRYGWIQFFSQLTDQKLLHALDSFVSRQIYRFQIPKKRIRIKRFVRAWYETNRNISNTSYIPNFDNFSNSMKATFLQDVLGEKTSGLTVDEIDFKFSRKIYKSISELERDVGMIS